MAGRRRQWDRHDVLTTCIAMLQRMGRGNVNEEGRLTLSFISVACGTTLSCLKGRVSIDRSTRLHSTSYGGINQGISISLHC